MSPASRWRRKSHSSTKNHSRCPNARTNTSAIAATSTNTARARRALLSIVRGTNHRCDDDRWAEAVWTVLADGIARLQPLLQLRKDSESQKRVRPLFLARFAKLRGERIELDVHGVVLGDSSSEGIADLEPFSAVHVPRFTQIPGKATGRGV